jgi:hypothetical protein
MITKQGTTLGDLVKAMNSTDRQATNPQSPAQ